MAQRSVKSTFHPPRDEVVSCPYCGQVIHARWVTDEEVQVTSPVCSHYMGHDRAVFWFDNPRPKPWDWDPEKAHHHN